MGMPVWARWIRSRGATKDIVGELDVPVRVGGQEIRPGDLVVLDADGVTVVAAERAEEVLEASLAREEKEADQARASSQAGALSYELDGLRAIVEGAVSELAHLGPVELLTPRGEESLRVLRRRSWAWRSSAQDGRLDVPARLGRLPALVAQAHRARHARHGRARPARLEPGGARAARRRGRGGRARRGLGRRRPRPRPVLPLPRPRRPRASSSTTSASATSRRRTCAPR